MGSHQVNARVAAGKAPPSPTPTSSRHATSDAMPHERPVRIVPAAHTRLSAARTRRGPKRSAAHPPAICIAAYGYANAEKRMPSWIGVRPRSRRTSGAAVVAGFVAATRGRGADRAPEWYVTTAGLLAVFAGLLIVRLILMRSVSLRLLGRVDRGAGRAFDDDIGIRVREMRVFGLA